jgi:hypothetical protein
MRLLFRMCNLREQSAGLEDAVRTVTEMASHNLAVPAVRLRDLADRQRTETARHGRAVLQLMGAERRRRLVTYLRCEDFL